MNSFVVLSLLAVGAGLVHASSIGNLPRHGTFDLAKLMRKHELDLEVTDPAVSSQCFNTYLPQLDDAASEWSTSYNGCLGKATNDRSDLNTKLTQDQASINASATDIIDAISHCQSIDGSLEFFTCFGGLGRDTLNTLYVLSANASEDAVALSQQFGGIDATMYICTNATERAYVEQTAKVYEKLDSCLQKGPSDTSDTTDSGSTEPSKGTTVSA